MKEGWKWNRDLPVRPVLLKKPARFGSCFFCYVLAYCGHWRAVFLGFLAWKKCDLRMMDGCISHSNFWSSLDLPEVSKLWVLFSMVRQWLQMWMSYPRPKTSKHLTFKLMTSAKPRVLLCLGETLYLGWSIGAWEVVCGMRASIKAPMNFCLEKGNVRFAWWTWRNHAPNLKSLWGISDKHILFFPKTWIL